MFVFRSSTGVMSSISLASSQLSRNSLKSIDRAEFSSRCPRSLVIRKMHLHLRRSSQQILLWLLFQTNRTNQVHFTKYENGGIVGLSLGLHTKKVGHSVPGCSYRIDSTIAFVPGKTLTSIKQIMEQDRDDVEQRWKKIAYLDLNS